MKTKKAAAKTQNKLVAVSAIIIVSALAIGAMFIYKPFSDKNKSLRTDILQERDKNILIGKIKALSKYLKVYDKRIPESGSVSWLLGEISNMASKERIDVSSIKPGNPEDYGLYTKLFVTVDAVSNYNQIGSFIAMIESSEKFLKIESVNIKRIDLDDGFDKSSSKFKAFDVKANIIISSIAPKE